MLPPNQPPVIPPSGPPPSGPPPIVPPTVNVVQAVNNVAPPIPAPQPNGAVPCTTAILATYHTNNQAVHQQLVDPNVPAKKNRKLSEALGEQAAICANSQKKQKQETQSDYQIFDGRDVFDLVQEDATTGDVTIFEAKGGKSQFGTRKGKGGKTIKQCTQKYARFVANKMKTTNYKGRHPRVACATHSTGSPVPTCKDCKAAERKRRNKTGQDILDADAQGKLHKMAVRGDYNKSGLKDPKVIESW